MRRVCNCHIVLYIVAMTISMVGCSTSSPPISVGLSPSSPQAIDQAQIVAITASVTNDSSNGVSWSLTGPGSLSSSTGPSVTYSSPIPNLPSAQQVVVTATSTKDTTKSASVQITVNPYLQMPFQTLPNGSVGTPYTQTIALIGGTPPFQWSVYDGPIITGWMVGGSVPDGLTLNANTGTISGTPTGGGTWYFEGTVTDATGAFADNGFLDIQINPSGPAGNPVPLLNQPLVPTAVSPGGPGFTLILSGTGFVPGAGIDFNDVGISTTFVDSEHLIATIPAAIIATAATAPVTVINPSPGGGSSNVVYFQIAAPETTVSFAAAANLPVQIYVPLALAVGDFNEDSKQDLAIAGGVEAYVMLGNGDGTFALSSGSPMRMPSPPYDDLASPYLGAIATGDFNKSGHQGLAVGLASNLATEILFGKGDGTFTYADTLGQTDEFPLSSLTAADFNGDGNLDLEAVFNLPQASPSTLLGYSHGAFKTLSRPFTPAAGLSSAAGDFNGDGKLDMVIFGPLALEGANILLGNGDGTFTQGWTSSNGGNCVTVADFNGDGKLDLAVCNGPTNSVTIFLGDGAGNFTAALSSPVAVGNTPDAIVVGDFNNDGKLDLAVANSGDGTVTLLLGNGDGTFTPASSSPYAVGNYPIGIAAADFNGDGKLDLAVTNLTDGTVSILLQQ